MTLSSDTLRTEEVTDTEGVRELAELCDLALQSDSIYELFNTHYPSSVLGDAIVKLTDAIKDTNSKVFRAMLRVTNEDGTTQDVLVGVTQWYIGYLDVPKVDPFAPKLDTAQSEEIASMTDVAVSDQSGVATPIPAPIQSPTSLSDPVSEHFRVAGNAYVSAIRGKRHVYLRRIFVHPAHQKRGIGQRLIQWGVDYADKQKIVCWLFARPAGSKMYQNNGWKAVASLPFEVPGMEIEPSLAMLRMPQPYSASTT